MPKKPRDHGRPCVELALALNADGKKSLQTQIYDQIRTLILNGRLKAGMAVPPSRSLAEKMAVSRNTVCIAYERLVAEGYLEARGTAGIFVTAIPPDSHIFAGTCRENYLASAAVADLEGDPLLCFAGSAGGRADRLRYDFWPGRSASSSFPLAVWRSIISKLLATQSRYLTDYCDPAGLPELRQAIADYLARSRGMDVSSNQIIITAGSQDAINLVLNLLQDRIRQLCIENPCYLGASMLFLSAGMPIEPITVDKDGLQTDLLPGRRGSLLYVTPSHQFPTGVMMTLNRRLALLKWAEHTESYIIEDDYDSDFRYDGPPLTALAGLDRGRRVFYVGTFSKSVGAGVRLGFAVVPRIYWEEARQMKARMSNGQSWLEQRVMAEFISEGHFDRHVRKLRHIYRSRRDILLGALERHFPDPITSGHDSGLHFVWKLPPGLPNARDVQRAARLAGIGVYALSSGAAFDFTEGMSDDMVMLGYSSLTEAEIEKAIDELASLLRRLST
jgi:GntR family transcriptional regulator/MocR family aminotransferase